MATTAAKSAITPDAVVTINNGVPSSVEVKIPSKGVVQFTADPHDYLLELFDRCNDRHPAALVYLPASSSVYVVGGPEGNDQNATCWYNVLFYPPAAAAGNTEATGGGNKIIIGSGN